MKYYVFWCVAIPVMIVAMVIDWQRGVKPVSSLAWAGAILIAEVVGWIHKRKETKAGEKANDAAVRCKHGIKSWHSCKGCAEEFAYFETCLLCGMIWDNRTQKHDHKLIPDANGKPEYYINGQKQMMSSSWITGSYSYPSFSSGHRMSQCLTIDTTCRPQTPDVGPIVLKQQVMKLAIPPEDQHQTHG